MTKYLPITPEEIERIKPHRSAHVNSLTDKYVLDVENEYKEKSTPFCKAYHLKNNDFIQDSNVYGLVFAKHISPRTEVIHSLRENNFPSLAAVHDAQLVSLSHTKQEHYCIVVDGNQGISLRALLEKKHKFSDSVIKKHIILPLIKLFREMEAYDISHGSINLDTLYLEGNHVYVSECISCPSGYSQNIFFETTYRAMIQPTLGKGEAETTDDFYALGMVILCLLTGRDIFARADEEESLRKRLKSGSYNYINELVDDKEIPYNFRDLLIGLLNDIPEERWDAEKVFLWLKGKQYNLIHPMQPTDGTRSILFNGEKFYNKRALCYALHTNWGKAKRFLREDSLVKWVEGSLNNNDLANELRAIKKITVKDKRHYQSFDAYDDIVAQTILMLDPAGPFRLQKLCFNLNSVGLLLSSFFYEKKQDSINLLVNIIKNGILNTHFSRRKSIDLSERASSWAWTIDKASIYIKNNTPCFGIERCLYELNPEIPCLSSIIQNHYCTDIEGLIMGLEKEVPQLASEKSMFDRHICAYLAKLVKLAVEIKINSLARFMDLVKHSDLQNLVLLVMAAKKIKSDRYPNMCKHLYAPLIALIRTLHSNSIRETKEQKLESLIKEGKLFSVLKLMTDKQYYAQDYNGFKKAQKHYAELQYKKIILTNDSNVNSSGFRYGLYLSVLMAYFLCAIMVLYMVATNM